MTFQALETSYDQGEPILLFDFSVGIAHFRYTTADRAITYLSNAYASAPISRSPLKVGAELKQQTIEVTAGRDLGVAQLYTAQPPAIPVGLTITAMHQSDPDLQGVVDWIGRVMAARWKSSAVVLLCEPVLTSVQTVGLRRRWQIQCPHVLYGVQCGVNPAPYAVSATLSTVAGNVITAAPWTVAPGAGLSFTGGFVTFDNGTYIERRTINQWTLATGALALDDVLKGAIAGSTVIAYPGCDRSTTNCQAYSNLPNHGGDPYIPSINPMTGATIY
ncbi:MAG: phage BR0599 family protein [Proteobacteria bacterium]|nr:phage BR0599 family protein [Pseudomonadota bacterium]